MSKEQELEQMLKLYTKKDLWERMQHYIRTIDDKDQQISQLKAENESLMASKATWATRAEIYADLIVSLNDVLPDKQNEEINFQKTIESIKQQLAEKDAEIERLNYFKGRYYEMLLEKQSNTHQVCEEIRRMFEPDKNTNNLNEISFLKPTKEAELVSKGFKSCKKRVLDKLDQLENNSEGE